MELFKLKIIYYNKIYQTTRLIGISKCLFIFLKCISFCNEKRTLSYLKNWLDHFFCGSKNSNENIVQAFYSTTIDLVLINFASINKNTVFYIDLFSLFEM